MENRFSDPDSQRARERGPSAFGEFRQGLFRYLLRKLRHAENAEDLTQEVYLRLLRSGERQQVRNPQAYVFGVAFHVLYEFRLSEAQNPISWDSDAAAKAGDRWSDETASPEAIHERQAKEQWLQRVIARLSPMQETVLLMAKRQGLSHAEIAAKLGISIGTVRKHLARAISQCRRTSNE